MTHARQYRKNPPANEKMPTAGSSTGYAIIASAINDKLIMLKDLADSCLFFCSSCVPYMNVGLKTNFNQYAMK